MVIDERGKGSWNVTNPHPNLDPAPFPSLIYPGSRFLIKGAGRIRTRLCLIKNYEPKTQPLHHATCMDFVGLKHS